MAVDKPVAQETPSSSVPAETASQDAKAQAVTMDQMRDYFASQKKVSVKVREQAWVQVNGYTFIIEPNQRVEVPEDIAEMLETRGLI